MDYEKGLGFFVRCHMVIGTSGCRRVQGRTDQAKLVFGSSERFTAEEVHAACAEVTKAFKSYTACELLELRYEEEKSDAEIASSNDADAENMIVLFSDFYVPKHGAENSLDPDSTYEDWKWYLVREDAESAWKVKSWGYA